MAAFIIECPTATGKSHFVVENPTLPVVDGDVIISDVLGWPAGDWWLDVEKATRTSRENAEALADWHDRHPSHAVLFNGVVPREHVFGTVLIPKEDILAHLRSRTTQRSEGGGRPINVTEVMANYDAVAAFASSEGITVYPSISAAVDAFIIASGRSA